MYKKLLVLLDGSQVAEVVLPYAREIAGRLDMDVVLLHVYPPPGWDFAPMHKAYLDHTAEIIKTRARQLQAKFGKVDYPLEVTFELIPGYHADEILRYADQNKIDLILLASHGRSGIKQWTLGGVADKILRASKVPVWLVKVGVDNAIPYDQWPEHKLLVPLSGSDVSSKIIPHARGLARQKGIDGVVLLRVCEPTSAPTYYAPELTSVPLNWGKFAEQELARSKEAAQKYLAEVEKEFKQDGVPVTSLVLVGKPADEIINYGIKNPFTVVVMATHGRSGLSRLVYGSVAESVLFGINNPIVFIRPQ